MTMLQDNNAATSGDHLEQLFQEVNAMLAPVMEEKVYEGNVKVRLEGAGCAKRASEFIRELRNTPELRLLRLDGKSGYGADIWLGLREPFRLKTALGGMNGVSQVAEMGAFAPTETGPVLNVRLTRAAA